jgi:hypothetical protein
MTARRGTIRRNEAAVLTTAQFAAYGNFSQQMAIRLIDAGQVPGAFRVPMSSARRVPLTAAVKFFEANGLPVPDELRRRVEALQVTQVAQGQETQPTDGVTA